MSVIKSVKNDEYDKNITKLPNFPPPYTHTAQVALLTKDNISFQAAYKQLQSTTSRDQKVAAFAKGKQQARELEHQGEKARLQADIIKLQVCNNAYNACLFSRAPCVPRCVYQHMRLGDNGFIEHTPHPASPFLLDSMPLPSPTPSARTPLRLRSASCCCASTFSRTP